ncbi:type VI secretion system lipoprotein TssJ [Pseudomonas sp. GD03842]|uniref:type VI secretion system lipoprotein TssJ n=1 Tax=Pseudomonas sp. GD03842 TaxID=2975385 RepID=UPI002449BBA1|nr:type VI secretion system lipoprotein TssJ [Pseudomonas sp. GD03842]MDH0749421.1 type VI secretion system lipoprotein TssJ [Pseudomonas sp. GD03842]
MFQRVGLAAAMALLLMACSRHIAPPNPFEGATEASRVVLHFTAADGLNPGGSGQPAPVRVRLFELKNAASFNRADYFALAERAQDSLGSDLVDQDEVLLQPGQHLTVERTLDAATRRVGLVVGYRELDQALWRAVLDVPPRMSHEFEIALDTLAVRTTLSAPSTHSAH